MRDGYLAATAGLRIPVRSEDAIRTRTYWRNMRSLMQRTAPLILIVDHDAATLAVCEELLRSAGYRRSGVRRPGRRGGTSTRTDLIYCLRTSISSGMKPAGICSACYGRSRRPPPSP